ncbi:MAG: protoporphyrinogen oxidase [Acidobacteriota bacterium]|nr:protoporphyrinogen oxidase [Acidobacteriota bacterium]
MTTPRVIVAGGGIAGLTCAYTVEAEAARLGRKVDVLVIDAGHEAGGHARTVEDAGWLVERGPNGFLDSEPETMALIEELGLSPDLVEANARSRRRFVLRGGALVQVPTAPPALLSSPIISWPAKLRLLREPWAKAAPPHADETVFEFAERRLGREVAEVLVDTAVAGISAGDSRQLSVRSHFPILVEWERNHGGLFRALLARRKTAPRRPRLLSFARGLGTLPRTLADRLAPRVMTGRAITNISRHAQAWQVQLACGLSLPADQVVFATPASQTSAILRELDGELASELAAIPYAGLAVVALGYAAASLGRGLDGYGYLVARSEQLATIGVLWESSIFPGRAPDGAVLLRVFLGGARRPDVAALDDATLTTLARTELVMGLGIADRPIRHQVFRWPAAIAQYTVGHDDRVAAIRERLESHPGLDVCGTACDGVSFNHAIAAARRTARSVATRLLGEA